MTTRFLLIEEYLFSREILGFTIWGREFEVSFSDRERSVLESKLLQGSKVEITRVCEVVLNNSSFWNDMSSIRARFILRLYSSK